MWFVGTEFAWRDFEGSLAARLAVRSARARSRLCLSLNDVFVFDCCVFPFRGRSRTAAVRDVGATRTLCVFRLRRKSDGDLKDNQKLAKTFFVMLQDANAIINAAGKEDPFKRLTGERCFLRRSLSFCVSFCVSFAPRVNDNSFWCSSNRFSSRATIYSCILFCICLSSPAAQCSRACLFTSSLASANTFTS